MEVREEYMEMQEETVYKWCALGVGVVWGEICGI